VFITFKAQQKEEFIAITIHVEIHCHHLYFVHHVAKVTKVAIA
jgi:hypothetical protein